MSIENPVQTSTPTRQLTDLEAANLRTLYDQLCNSYRAIDDFRAKLLGFLPLASGTGLFLLFNSLPKNNDISDQTRGFLVSVGVFGFVVTLGLFVYEIFSIMKCHELIKTGKHIEYQLGFKGQFKTRPGNVLHIINEPFAAGVIYPTVLAAWAYLALFFAGSFTPALAAALVFLIGFTVTVAYIIWLKNDGEKPVERDNLRRAPANRIE